MTITSDRADAPAPAPPPNQRSTNSGSASSRAGGLVVAAMAATLVVIAIGVTLLGVVAYLRDEDAPAAGGGGGGTASTTLNVQLTEFAINGDLTAPAGRVQVHVTNSGSIEHNLALVDPPVSGGNLMAGGSETLDLGVLAPGTYRLICEIAGHEASGMSTDLVITDGDTGDVVADGGTDHSNHDEMTAEQMDRLMIESMLAFPTETEGRGNELLEYEVLPDGTKQFELTAAVTPWEVAPGEWVDAWSYNGIVPGPMIRVDLGDRVQVVVHNETPMGTDVHWHGIITPNDQDGVAPYTQDVISTGETFVYEFDAVEPAIAMYHAHMHGQVSVPNGMFGAFIIGDTPIPYGQTISGVEIPEDLELVVDMPMVVNDAGVIGLTLNGKSFPATEPLVLNQGDWASVHYYNEGLMPHPMHLHRFPQLVYAKDGIPLDQPYWADTINIAPGERYSVLFHADDPGTWVWHCHILTHVEADDGMFGMATAVIVNPAT